MLLFALLSAATGPSQICDGGDSIVKKVSFENAGGLTSEQKSTLSHLLMGRCFYHADGSLLGEAVYRQLRRFGYRNVFVEDPIIRVLDRSVRPSPVSITVDFVLTNPDGVKRFDAGPRARN